MENAKIDILEGEQQGGYMLIAPVRHVQKRKDNLWTGIEVNYPEAISIDDIYVAEFLSPFLYKFFDDDYPYGYERIVYSSFTGFEWNLEHNIYTYDVLELMLKEIEQSSHLLGIRYDDPKLDLIKRNFNWHTFIPGQNYSVTPSVRIQQRIIRDNINVAIDFYNRFVSRMGKMLQDAWDYNRVTFYGP